MFVNHSCLTCRPADRAIDYESNVVNLPEHFRGLQLRGMVVLLPVCTPVLKARCFPSNRCCPIAGKAASTSAAIH